MSKLNLLDFSSTKAKIKYTCAKQAVEISSIFPEELYTDLNTSIFYLPGKSWQLLHKEPALCSVLPW
jgi:hypothetical protein